jgi:hypothetical protein
MSVGRCTIWMMTAKTEATGPATESLPGSAPKPRKQKKPVSLVPIQILNHTGLSEWQLRAAFGAGLVLPEGPPWPVAIADDILARRDEIIAVVGTDAPLGGHRAAERLGQRTGLEVAKWDVEALVDAGALQIDSYFNDWPLYDCRALDAIPAEQLEPLVADRLAWIEASVHAAEAADNLGWRRAEFRTVADGRGLNAGH